MEGDDYVKIQLPNTITLGGEHNGSAVDWGIFGKVTDLNIWTRILKENEISAYTKAKTGDCADMISDGKVTCLLGY